MGVYVCELVRCVYKKRGLEAGCCLDGVYVLRGIAGEFNCCLDFSLWWMTSWHFAEL